MVHIRKNLKKKSDLDLGPSYICDHLTSCSMQFHINPVMLFVQCSSLPHFFLLLANKPANTISKETKAKEKNCLDTETLWWEPVEK